MHRDDAVFARFLCEVGLLSRPQLSHFESQCAAGVRLSEALVREGVMNEEALRRAQAKCFEIPFVTLTDRSIAPEVLASIPEAYCRTHQLVPYERREDALIVACLDLAVLDALWQLNLPYTVVGHLTDRQSLKFALLQYQKFLSGSQAAGLVEEVRAVVPPMSNSVEDLRYSAERLPTARALDRLLQHALAQRVSEVHCEPGEQGFRIRYRAGEGLYDALVLPAAAAPSIQARLKMLGALPLERQFAEGAFRIALPGTGETVRIRVVSIPLGNGGEKVLLRLVNERDRRGYSLESLGFGGGQIDDLHHALCARSGLVLVTGGERSGKTTLLYTLLDQVADPTKHVASVEERIEVRLPAVTQTAIDREQGTGFAERLRAVLKTRPDRIMIADCTDAATATLALNAANRGALVILGMRQPTVAEALAELGELVSPRALATSFQLGVSTQLFPRLCPNHESIKLSRGEIEALEDAGVDLGRVLIELKSRGALERSAQWKDVRFDRATPCPECENGFVGYTGVHEVVPQTLTLKDALLAQAPLQELERILHEEHPTLLEDSLVAAAQGRVSIDSLFEAA